METPNGPRKLVRHFDVPGEIHELTFSCYCRMPLLNDDRRRRLLSRSIDAALVHHGYHLIGFVYMPEHVHLLVLPLQPDARVSRLLYAIKRPFSFRVKEQLRADQSPLLRELTVRERPGKDAFRFWQEGGGYDRNLTSSETVLLALEYIHQNPVKRGLCEMPGEWKWSSFKYYDDPSWMCDPDLPAIHGLPQ